jgi:MFS family permease
VTVVNQAMKQVQRGAVVIFFGFAFTYFFSALLRSVTATLAPVFSAELGIGAADLGLLAGAYFLGFAALQLPLGLWLDRHGPKKVLLSLLGVAAAGCAIFAFAKSLQSLIAARVLIGVGLSACLMAPLTCYRSAFSPTAQLRANSWMLMTGSLGMLASTLPVQWLMPHIGWRGLFLGLAAMIAVSMLLITFTAPRDQPHAQTTGHALGYAAIARHPLFRQMAPLGFFLYGGMLAMQSLWIGPWLTRVALYSPAQAAAGLFTVNLCMLIAFMTWGGAMPRLLARGLEAQKLMLWGVPLSLALLAINLMLGSQAGAWSWALWCVSSTVVSLSQPAVALVFPKEAAGRALSAFNLVIFGGVFALQWGLGLLIDHLVSDGMPVELAFRGAMGAFWICCVASYVWFVLARERSRKVAEDNVALSSLP